ncbi:g3148 [Coccomyxa viridis]|uniref:G3148 protein n=1 Tax=Coccomyxa viridis TaxID=1274662 RepID=A0ABP1FM43_9CHLO
MSLVNSVVGPGIAAPSPSAADPCAAGADDGCTDPDFALKLRIGAVFILLASSTLGVWLPFIAGKVSPYAATGSSMFFMLKAFGAGVILATGFIHMWPDANDAFSSACLGWPDYPWASLFAMVTILCVLILEHVVSRAYERRLTRQLTNCTRTQGADGHAAANGNPAGALANVDEKELAQRDAHIRSFAIAQVLESGIAFHSVLIGIALGVSDSPCTIRPLLAALTFHQFFEGVALGSCLLQASFRSWAFAAMAFIFTITTPIGIAIGIGIASTYNANSTNALITQGIFDSVSTGILIYMSLVDLIAPDFNSPQFLASLRLQLGGYTCLILGAALMAIIGIWA